MIRLQGRGTSSRERGADDARADRGDHRWTIPVREGTHCPACVLAMSSGRFQRTEGHHAAEGHHDACTAALVRTRAAWLSGDDTAC